MPTTATLIPEVIPFERALGLERELMSSARDLGEGEARCLVWRTQKAIIVPRGLPGRDYFQRARGAVEALGFPVFERDTGGDLTPQDPGIVNLSLAFRMDGAQASIKDAYLRLTTPVIAFLSAHYEIKARTAAIPGAFCDGEYNIAIDDKKIAGTAQRWKLLGGEGTSRRVAVLAHVALMVQNDFDPAIEALNAFYTASGSDRRILRERHITLKDVQSSAAINLESVAATLATHVVAHAGS